MHRRNYFKYVVRFLSVICLFVLLLGMGIGLDKASVAAQTRTIKVAIKPLKPFVIKQGDAFAGFSIDLWKAIAQRNNWQTEFVWHDTLKEVLTDVQTSKADAGIAGISITEAREKVMDFSHPMFNAGLQIMANTRETLGMRSFLRNLLNPDLLRIILIMLGMVVVAGHVIWWMERKNNVEFQHGYLRGVWEGIWWSAVTVATVGYGDRTPKSNFGRLFAIAWMFTGIILVSNFTATVTSNITLEEIRGNISSLQDLSGKRVVSVANSTAAIFLDSHAITHTDVDAIEAAYALLENNQADAIVYDAPVLLYHVAKETQANVKVVGGILKPEQYGIALPQNSVLREPINQALLALQADGSYTQIYNKWFGKES